MTAQFPGHRQTLSIRLWAIAVVCGCSRGPGELVECTGNGIHAVRAVGEEVDDDVMVVVHGGPGVNKRTLRVVEGLIDGVDGVPSGWDLVFYDQRGSGLSERPADREYALDAHLDDLDCVRQWADPERVVLLGHSWGGLVSMAYASSGAPGLAGVVLVDPTAASPGMRMIQDIVLGQRTENVDRHISFDDIDQTKMDSTCRAWWPTVRTYYANPRDARALDFPGTCSDVAHRASLRATHDVDLRPTNARVEVPVLVVYGEADPMRVAMPEIVESMTATRAMPLILRDCGHRPMYECPDSFGRALRSWLRDMVPPAKERR